MGKSTDIIVGSTNEMAKLASPVSGLAALVTAASGPNAADNPFAVAIAIAVVVYAGALMHRGFGLLCIFVSVMVLCFACGVIK